MTLGELIKTLEQADPTMVVPHGFGSPHSYRGYYEDVAFSPAANVSVASMLEHARSALGQTFTGYKGGEYTMGDWTDCWISEYSTASGDKIGDTLMYYMLRQKD